jgi:hypothetical protein
MKKVLVLMFVGLFAFGVLACGDDDDDSGGGTVCDQAADIQIAAMEEACGEYDECCTCDCLLEGESDIEGCDCSAGEGEGEEAECEGDAEAAAEECLEDEEACAQAAKDIIDLACSM